MTILCRLKVWFRAHIEGECCAADDVGMRDFVAAHGLSVDENGLHIAVLRRSPRRAHNKALAVWLMDDHACEERSPKHVGRRSVTSLLNAHRTTHVPSRHLPCVVVAGQSA